MKGWLLVAVATLLALAGMGNGVLDDGISIDPSKPRHVTHNAIPFGSTPPAVVISNEVGSITVHPGPGMLKVTKQWSVRAPKVTTAWHGSTLVITGTCPDNLSFNSCSIDLELSMPAAFALDASQNVGDVVARDTTGTLRLDSGVGSVLAERARGDVLTARVGSGDIDLRAIAFRRISARAGNGESNVDSTVAPDLVDAHASNGSVDVGVPVAAYAIKIDVGWGDQEVRGLTSDPASPRQINADVGNGDVLVHSR